MSGPDDSKVVWTYEEDGYCKSKRIYRAVFEDDRERGRSKRRQVEGVKRLSLPNREEFAVSFK